jgi:lysophospholipase L1-like esterase
MKRKLLLSLFSCVFAFLLAEGVARLFFPEWAPRTGRLAQFWQYDPMYGWAHVPGTKGIFDSFGIHSSVTINERGLRGPVIPHERTGRARVLMVGDSYVWGYGVNDDETAAAVLGRMIPGLEVINMGVSGYSTDQELLMYREEGYKYHADDVVLVFSTNDVAGNVSPVVYQVYGKPLFVLHEGQLQLENQPVAQTAFWKRAVVNIAGRSYLLNTVNRLVADIRLRRNAALQPAAGAASAGPSAQFPSTPAEQVTTRLLVEFQRAAEERKSHLVVVLVEDLGQSYARQFADYLRNQHIDTLIMGEVLREGDKSLHLPDGFHWTPAGNRIVAETIAAYLERRKAVP